MTYPITSIRRSVRKIEQRGDTLFIQCMRCGIMKPQTRFAKYHASLLGRNSFCNDCVNKLGKKRMQRIRARRELSRVA
jgi:ribosomal protein S26